MVVSQHALQVSRPTPRREVEGLAGGRGVSRLTPGGCIPACTEADTSAGDMHPTGMHSCLPDGFIYLMVLFTSWFYSP